MTNHHEAEAFDTSGNTADRYAKSSGPAQEQKPITLRSAAELADALPYLLGYRPGDSIVLAAIHADGGHGTFGGRARLAIPARAEEWPTIARKTAESLIDGIERRRGKPDGMIVYLSQEPRGGESGREVMERLRPLAQTLRTSCGALDVPVVEALCLSGGRLWSYCCPGRGCCPPEGVPMGVPGTSVLAAAATFAGIQVRGSLEDLHARLTPWRTEGGEMAPRAAEQERELDAACTALVPRMLGETERSTVAEDTLDLARHLTARLAEAPPSTGEPASDRRDDGLVANDEAAALILGLQDRDTRDRAAEWMEGDEARQALRLWRALARRCVGRYGEHAAAPLTLAGWVAWSLGDELEAREALAMALAADPQYTFAMLLHRACNEGVEPEAVRKCLRQCRADREAARTRSSGTERKTEVPGTGNPASLAERRIKPLPRRPSTPPKQAPHHAKPVTGRPPKYGPRVPSQSRRVGRRGARNSR
ncbi:DUF4192 domain-containing protein [Streptomyces sp. NA04227]|uniref:DUF4192 domain-containing protein n=1 Tax=Streptomyces sp. NA04227 TaxID=2742136 RepID=UPI00158FFF6D|nr:DUF4192 domain-containing protein [Streptomyces sp. NA04227]QKW09618.1 DUF4192 domain-containing protein [Streptomyces sp. NA04227]